MISPRRADGSASTIEAHAVHAKRNRASGILVGHFRWVICTLLLFGVTKNYMDRQVLGVLKITLQHELGWNEIDYANLVFAFQAAYATGMIVVGRLVDRLGVRWGYALTMIFWSLASMAHAAGSSLASFMAARTALGFGEAGVFPASIKAVAEWFPKKERAFATGIFNSGTNIGAIVTPLLLPWLTKQYGWQGAFIATGSIGFLWLMLWLSIYRPPEEHKRVSAAEFAYIRSDPGETITPIPWKNLMGYRQTWAFALGKFLTDPVWWLYLFWVPDFLHRTHGLNLAGMVLPLVVIYNVATVGSIVGGWLSSTLIRRGWNLNRSRKTTMLLCALAVVPIVAAAKVSGLWPAVLLISLASAAHQGWSANIYTLVSDMFPRRAVGSVVGIGGMAGAVGGMMISEVVGHLLQWTGSYFFVFLLAGGAYLFALLVIHILVPHLEPAQIDTA